MVDKALFVDTSGASNSMKQLEIITNNLANANTTGFRADYEVMKPYEDLSKDNQTRVHAVLDKTYSDFDTGPVINTGRDLDVSVSGQGFIAVQSKNGQEGYTRAGDLQIRDNLLTTQSGDLVMGTNGVISFPANIERISIGRDGTVSARVKGETQAVTLNRIKLTKPPLASLQKGNDGLFYLSDGGTAKADDNITLTGGALEGSNVNPIKTLTDLIELSRNFEFHANLMKTLEDNSGKANQILNAAK